MAISHSRVDGRTAPPPLGVHLTFQILTLLIYVVNGNSEVRNGEFVDRLIAQVGMDRISGIRLETFVQLPYCVCSSVLNGKVNKYLFNFLIGEFTNSYNMKGKNKSKPNFTLGLARDS